MNTDYSKFYTDEEIEETKEFEAELEAEEIEEEEDPACFGRVASDRLYLRVSNSKDSDHIAILEKDDELLLDQGVSEIDDWVHVVTQSGVEGYVMKKFVTVE